MTDYDRCTDKEIADLLETLNIELVKKGLLHAGDDCIMMVAFRRLREYGNMPNLKRHNLKDDELIELHREFERLHIKRILAQYTVVEDDDSSIKTYNNFKLSTIPISAIADYFAKRKKAKSMAHKGNPTYCDCEACLKLKGEF